jgi:outer membrane receptor protein involved in Fe transport
MPLADGPLQLGSGVSAFNEHYSYQPSDLAQGLGGDSLFGADANEVPLDASRQIYGAFIELVAPLAKGVELTAGLRHDHYSDFGSTTNAKLSGRWLAAPGVRIVDAAGTFASPIHSAGMWLEWAATARSAQHAASELLAARGGGSDFLGEARPALDQTLRRPGIDRRGGAVEGALPGGPPFANAG